MKQKPNYQLIGVSLLLAAAAVTAFFLVNNIDAWIK